MSHPHEMNFLTVDEALQTIDSMTLPNIGSEEIPVAESNGRILAKNQTAKRDIPQFDNSAMDGFLFLKSDLDDGLRSFSVAGEIRPEHDYDSVNGPEPGNCKRIMTGAAVPKGDFFVIPVELTEENEDGIEVKGIPGNNPVRRKGEGYKKGKTVLEKGCIIRPYEAGLMIESGNKTCSVQKKIRIAIQVTGSEIDEDMNTNGPVLQGLIQEWPACEVKIYPVLDDKPKLVLSRMKKLKTSADIVLTTGGISMGRHDYILSAMQELGAEILIRKIRQKPGKPFTVSRLDDTVYFHLPGNPISAVFCAEYYVRRFVQRLIGFKNTDLKAVVKGGYENPRDTITLFAPGKLAINDRQQLTVSSAGVMQSHLLQLYRGNDVYVRLDPETEYHEGDEVQVTPFSTTRL